MNLHLQNAHIVVHRPTGCSLSLVSPELIYLLWKWLRGGWVVQFAGRDSLREIWEMACFYGNRFYPILDDNLSLPLKIKGVS